MFFARDFEYSREGRCVGIDSISDLVGDMLVNQYDADVFSLCRKRLKGSFDGRCLCLVVDN